MAQVLTMQLLRCIGLLLLAVAPAWAEDLGLDRLEHFTTEDGLSQNWVLHLTQDRAGFLWLSTDNGLNRFDGLDFKVYNHDPEDPHSISDSFVICVFEDRAGDLWVGTRNGLNRLDRFTDRFERFLPDPTRDDSLSDHFITDIEEDQQGILWVATLDGLNRFDRETGGFRQFLGDPEDSGSLGSRGPLRILRTRAGDLWFGGAGETLHRFDRDQDRFERFPLVETGGQAKNVWALAEDATDGFWVGTSGGDVIHFDPHTKGHRRFPLSSRGIDSVQGILPRGDGSLWLGTEDQGLLVFDPKTEAFDIYRHQPSVPGSLSDNRVMSLFEDRTGIIWLATNAALDKLDPARLHFSHWKHHPEDPNSLSADWVSFVAEDRHGDLWVGSGGGGINHFDHRTGKNTRYRHDPKDPHSLVDDNVMAMLEDSEGRLWFGTHRGIDHLDPPDDRFQRAELGRAFHGDLLEGWIYDIVESEPGILWFGGAGGVNRLDTRTMAAELFVNDPQNPQGPGQTGVYDLEVDRDGALWIATRGAGLYLLEHPATAQRGATFHHFRHDKSDPRSLSSDETSVVFEDSAQRLWVGTLGGGLNRADRTHFENSEGERNLTFTRYREKDGLANDSIFGILEDDKGNLWLSSNRGLTRLNPDTGEAKSFGPEDGLQGNAFLLGAAGRRSNGELFFGGTSGLNGFFPDRLEDDSHPPQAAITDFRLFNRSLPLAERGTLSAQGGTILTLSHRDAILGFEFAALHFSKPGKNRYAYRLQGFNDDWIETDARNRYAQYTNLNAGDYVFQVKAANGDGLWSEDSTAVRITVLPAPWNTWWAQALYAATLLAVIFAYVRWQRAQVEVERKVAERERAASQRLREADRLKNEFLANTSHELRTPLYGITGLAESLIDGAAGEVSEEVRNNLSMIVASGHRLGHLVNDILDFSKLRHKSLELNRQPVDLRALVDVVLTLSRPLVGAKELRLENMVTADLPRVDADENRLQQILLNLVGNAIKFTEEGTVEVAAREEGERLVVQVVDTGIGIPASAQARVFDAFEQADASIEREFGGTGLGLSITRQLVELHGGEIWAESLPGQGATFSFTLPTAAEPVSSARPQPAPTVSAPVSLFAEPQPVFEAVRVSSTAEDAVHILVVDDEPVNRQVLSNFLALEHFNLVTASGGDEALRLIEEHHFDLVLLDVMMPKVSGFEVCRALRERYPMEDLPVLFLTAKNQTDDVVTGLSLGANDYLTKPISKNELLARMRPHLDLLGAHRHLEHMVAAKMSEIKVLEGLLPICSSCKKIRSEEGDWNDFETFIDHHSEAQFSHGICPDCTRELYPEYEGGTPGSLVTP